MIQHISRQKRFIVTGALAIFSAGFVLFFREADTLDLVIQGFIACAAFFLLIPVLYSRMVLGEPLESIGWGSGRFLPGAMAAAIAVSVGTAAAFFLVRFSPFGEAYTLPGLVESDFRWFVLYEAVMVPLVLLLYETFFRGMVQLLWFRDYPAAGIAVQTALFYGFFFLAGGVAWQNAVLLAFAPLAGAVAHVSRSIWYSLFAGWAVTVAADIFYLILH